MTKSAKKYFEKQTQKVMRKGEPAALEKLKVCGVIDSTLYRAALKYAEWNHFSCLMGPKVSRMAFHFCPKSIPTTRETDQAARWQKIWKDLHTAFKNRMEEKKFLDRLAFDNDHSLVPLILQNPELQVLLQTSLKIVAKCFHVA